MKKAIVIAVVVCLVIIVGVLTSRYTASRRTMSAGPEPDYDAVDEQIMQKYRSLMKNYNDVILAQNWKEKDRMNKASVALFEEAVSEYPDSPKIDFYRRSLAAARDATEQKTVDLEEFKQRLESGSLTQLRLAFEIYTQGHDGHFPAKLEDVLNEGMRGYLSCPIHKVPYIYHQPSETVKQIRKKYWREEEEGRKACHHREGTGTRRMFWGRPPAKTAS